MCRQPQQKSGNKQPRNHAAPAPCRWLKTTWPSEGAVAWDASAAWVFRNRFDVHSGVNESMWTLFSICFTRCPSRYLELHTLEAHISREAIPPLFFNSKKKKKPPLNWIAALVPPSAGTSGAVASGCLPDGPQAQGPLKGVNAIFEQGMGRCQLDWGLLLMDREKPWNCSHGGGEEMRRKWWRGDRVTR